MRSQIREHPGEKPWVLCMPREILPRGMDEGKRLRDESSGVAQLSALLEK